MSLFRGGRGGRTSIRDLEHPVKEKENHEAWCPRGLENEVFQKEVNPGNSLVNQ